jgi:2-amino-4-hydroxy-6-hydroxymethyldihydropteridine diphosphokinase
MSVSAMMLEKDSSGTWAVLLGSNLGDREWYLRRAREILDAAGFRVGASSDLYETQPVECGPQAPYLNQVLVGTVRVPAGLLLALCQRVEREAGRRSRQRHGPRTLDIDLLLCGNIAISTPGLMLPHPAIPRRRSILTPLADVAPWWRHPQLGKNVLELLAECKDPGWVRRFSDSR